MTLKINIKDGKGGAGEACVTHRNQLVVAPLDFSTAYAVTASVINTAFNFVGPQSGKQFIITDILLYANKGVGANDAAVDLYEATGDAETTVSKSILSIEMLKQTSRDISGLNLIVTAGRWVNIKTDDNTIFATIMGYYVDA